MSTLYYNVHPNMYVLNILRKVDWVKKILIEESAKNDSVNDRLLVVKVLS